MEGLKEVSTNILSLFHFFNSVFPDALSWVDFLTASDSCMSNQSLTIVLAVDPKKVRGTAPLKIPSSSRFCGNCGLEWQPKDLKDLLVVFVKFSVVGTFAQILGPIFINFQDLKTSDLEHCSKSLRGFRQVMLDRGHFNLQVAQRGTMSQELQDLQVGVRRFV